MVNINALIIIKILHTHQKEPQMEQRAQEKKKKRKRKRRGKSLVKRMRSVLREGENLEDVINKNLKLLCYCRKALAW